MITTIHPQRAIPHPRYRIDIEVDEGIADLIADCWRLSFDTVMSCQDNVDGMVWILFATAEDALGFVATVAPEFEPDLDSLYQRVYGTWDGEGRWSYDAHLDDLSIEGHEDGDDWVDESIAGPFPVISISVRFPLSDQAEVQSRLRNAPKFQE